ncbi:MAG: sodium/proton-translocating pyrophosphatase, partial [Kineosporiaceae bacterium]
MPGTTRAAVVGQEVNLSGGNVTLVVVVAAIAVLALVMGILFRRQVLAASEGTESMQTIARAVQEGASAYLNRQFNTLKWFVLPVFLVLFLL